MKLLLCALSSLSVFCLVNADPGSPIDLWPEGVPGESKPLDKPESVELKGDHKIEIMSNVSIPQLTMYPAKNPNGTAVIVCPGGGYSILAYSHEGKEVCEWLNTLGITAGLLKYRVPRRDQLAKHDAPLQDLQRAIGMMRARADEWKIKSNKIGVLGFSAGGHLASMALTSDGTCNYKYDPKFDSNSVIPNFAVLVYAAYQLDESNPDKLSAEIKVTDKTPPAFLVVAHGDKKWAEGSARFYIEMKRANRDCELHIFGKGGHGFGLKNTEDEIKQWPKLAAKWMQAMSLVE